jgi:hypothetical protein
MLVHSHQIEIPPAAEQFRATAESSLIPDQICRYPFYDIKNMKLTSLSIKSKPTLGELWLKINNGELVAWIESRHSSSRQLPNASSWLTDPSYSRCEGISITIPSEIFPAICIGNPGPNSTNIFDVDYALPLRKLYEFKIGKTTPPGIVMQ